MMKLVVSTLLAVQCLVLLGCNKEPEPAAAPVRRAEMGIVYVPEGLPPEGIMVFEVSEGGAAEEIGIRPGDVIVQLDEKPIRTTADLLEVSVDWQPEQVVHVGLERKDECLEFEVTLQPTSFGNN